MPSLSISCLPLPRMVRPAGRARQRRPRQRHPSRRGAASARRRPPALRPLRPVLGGVELDHLQPLPRSGPAPGAAAAARPRDAGRRPVRRPLEPDRRGVPGADTPDEAVFLPGRNVLLLRQGDALVPPARRAGRRAGPAGEQPVPRRDAGLLRRLRGGRQPGRRRAGARAAAVPGPAQGGGDAARPGPAAGADVLVHPAASTAGTAARATSAPSGAAAFADAGMPDPTPYHGKRHVQRDARDDLLLRPPPARLRRQVPAPARPQRPGRHHPGRRRPRRPRHGGGLHPAQARRRRLDRREPRPQDAAAPATTRCCRSCGSRASRSTSSTSTRPPRTSPG